MKKKSFNIKNIAKISGFGVSTVSRVINNHPDVSDKTREKILKVIKEYNYIPNNSARNLKKTETNNIGLLVKGIYNPFFSEIVQIIENRINEAGYSMIIHYKYSDINDIGSAIQFIKEKRLKGLIYLGGDFNHEDDEQLKYIDTPIVITSPNIIEEVYRKTFSSIVIENEESAYDAVNYLIELGHKDIGVIAAEIKGNSIGELRLNGYKRALKENDIEILEDYIKVGDFTFESGFREMNKLLDDRRDISAVFSVSDIMAIGAAKAILKRGLKIPEDISIIAFDGIEYSHYFHPSISTIEQPKEQFAHKSIDILIDLIDKKIEHQHIVLDTKLLKRKSCKHI
ncbi:LacI family DNA-binding transcriptional regulator [Senegalia sp. (in: firmicutes)]|uniref:LacI family DNA-binding transcriptional regulator n=1 Tax=Senegalia sp. (in: firmicutes) TaxID=1924098 RepID=UPI003F9DD284